MYRVLQSLEMQPAGMTSQSSTAAKGASKALEPTSAQESKDPIMSKDKSSTTRSIASVAPAGDGANSVNASYIAATDQQQTQSQQPQESQQLQQQQSNQQQEQSQPPQPVQQQQSQQQQSNAASAAGDKSTITRRINPHKYLLYRPSLSQLFVYISTAFKDTADNGVMLLYLSADGCEYSDAHDTGYRSGVAMNDRKTQQQSSVSAASGIAAERSESTPAGAPSATGGNPTTATAASSSPSTAAQTAPPPIVSSVYCLHPADLIPFTRKPLFLIVDSSSSVAFSSIPNVFDQPVMSLMSPIEYPSSVQDRSEIGSLFTLFLHTPLLGFCSVSDIGNLDQSNWDECVSLISAMEQKIGEILLAHPEVDTHVKRFMTDEFLWTFIVRFTLCCIILRCHSSFKDEKTFPTCSPALPESIYSSPEIIPMLQNLTNVADVATYFSLPFLTEEPIEA